MPTITRVKISELVESTQRYVEGQVARTDKNRNGLLSRTESKQLAADLQDNFTASQFKTSWGSVRTEDFKREYLVMMEAFARSADTNRDGFLSTTEAKALPSTLRDNFGNYLAAVQKSETNTGGYVTRNITPSSRPAQHEAKFGASPISYEKAFELAVKAAATDEYGLRVFVQEFGGPDGYGLSDPAAIDAEVRQLLADGTMELIDVDEEIPSGESSQDYWIFSVSTEGQGDHGVWAIVDRKTGDTTVSTFN